MNDFHSIADAIAADIKSGRLAPGTRLPPQRKFADQHRIAASTASRVYAELARRGLTVGEVGRGTYVRSALATSYSTLSEPASAPIDLEMNIPLLPYASDELAKVVRTLAQQDALGHALKPIGAAATPQARQIAAGFMARRTWQPEPSSIFFTGNGRQAISTAMRALAAPGERIGVEALTYPVIKGIAKQLDITLVPLELDDQGLLPSSVLHAHQATPLKGVYLQPSLHNPLGCSMNETRRREVAAVLNQTGLYAIEDSIYGFLVDDLPLTAYAPDRVVFVDSFSKRIAPGLTIGLTVVPPTLVDKFSQCARFSAAAAAGFPLAIALQLMSDGTAADIAQRKRNDALVRQTLARQVLAGLELMGDPRAYHLWLKLPNTWRAETFVAAAARRGIALAPGFVFATTTSHAPNAVRIALSAPPLDDLRHALLTLRHLIDEGDTDIN